MRFLNLQHTRSDGEIDTYYCKAGREYRIGRGSMCEIRILDVRMSRMHANLDCGESGWTINDYASTNGCRINGEQPAMPYTLTVGDEITLGSTRLRVQAIEEHLTAPNPTVKAQMREQTVDENRDAPAVAAPEQSEPKSDRVSSGDSVFASTNDSSERTIFIKLLGKRVGPLTRSEAREFKKRELKDQLTDDDIADLIAE